MKKHEPINIYMLRHGKTKHNEDKVFQGHLDDVGTRLTEEGLSGVLSLSEFLVEINPSFIYSSDLKRSTQTAEIIANKLNKSFSAHGSLRGKKMGPFEGMKVKDYRSENKEVISKFDNLSDELQWDFHLAPGVESNREVLNRTLDFIKSLSSDHHGKNTLIVTHGGVIRNILFHLNWAKQHELKAGSVKNGAYIKISYDGENFDLKEVEGVVKGFEIF